MLPTSWGWGFEVGPLFVVSLLFATGSLSTGLVIGFALSIPLVLWFQAHPVQLSGDDMQAAFELFGAEPVLTWKLKPLNPIGSVATILGVAIVAALHPALKASRGRPVDVLRGL